MKKMWKLNNKAVSPVIATILMVAITVVLAAVLYVMVMGFGGNEQNAPTAVLGNASGVTATTATITLISISPETALTDLDVTVWTTTVTTISPTWSDIAGDDQASAGDIINIAGLTTGTDYTVYLIHVPTGDVLDSVEFTTL